MSGATREEALEMRLFKSKTPSPNALKVPSFFLKFKFSFCFNFKFVIRVLEGQYPLPNALKVPT